MNQFVVSARKYRPITFDTVVGQRHIAGTLKNAIKSEHLAQAFLFSGPRGVGKTTCARILAKTINCTNRNEQIEACDECESCKSFNDGHSLNIYELDAASNNHVDDIRALIDQVRFAPQIGSKKVYIIDEVHMLSTQAFNAFLKTLEEPPSHAIFILATTEKHKIIPTILSRCQIFDFNRIENDDLIRHLQNIGEKENVTSEHDALHLIAQKSDGSLRDALSMFDQMVTFSGQNLTYDAVVENLSILSADHFFELTDHLVSSQTAPALLLFNRVLQKGFDGHNFLLSLAEHLRNLLVCQDHSTIELLTAGKGMKERYREQTMNVTSSFLIKALNLVSRADVAYKSAKNHRLLVELTLVNIASLKSDQEPQVQKKAAVPTTVKPDAEVKKKPVEPIVETKSASEPVSTSSELPKKEIQESVSSPIEAKTDQKTEKSVVESAVLEVEEKDEEDAANTNKDESAVSDVKSETHEKIVESRISEPVKPKEEDLISSEKDETPVKDSFSDTISIASFTSQAQKKEETKTVEKEKLSGLEEGFDKEKLKEAWEKLAKTYEDKGRISLSTTFTKYEPELKDGTTIEVTYDNKAQLQSINSEMTNILEFLKLNLKNDKIELKTVLSDAEYQRPYTQAEKLDKLIEKNPDISLLKNKLDLDLGQ